MLDLIPVTVKTYSLDNRSDEYKALAARLTARGLRHFEVLHQGNAVVQDGVYHVETKHLFGDQSNTQEGARIFDWYDGMSYPSRRQRTGHYIEACEGFDQLQALRASVHQCGYCGAQYESIGNGWCDKCRGGEYLRPGDYHLLQLLPVAQTFNGRRDAEIPADMIDAIKVAQAVTAKRINDKQIADKIAKLESDIEHAKQELAFVNECINRGLVATDIANLIYYSHTGHFCFGWRDSLSKDDRLRIQAAIGDLASRHNVDFK